MTRYATAAILSQRIQQGLYPAGHRLPSVRTLSRARRQHQYGTASLPAAGGTAPVEARPKSGYFVHTQRAQAELPAMTAVQRPVDISQWEQVLELVRSRPREGLIQLGRGMPDIAEPTMKPLIVALRNAARHGDLRSLYYDSIQGVRAAQTGCPPAAGFRLPNRPRPVADHHRLPERFPPDCAPFANPATSWRSTRPASTAPCRR